MLLPVLREGALNEKPPNAFHDGGHVWPTCSFYLMNNDLFPELQPLPSAARWPNPNTRWGQTLQALLVAPQNQADWFLTWRLAAHVCDLIKLFGWAINKRDIPKSGNRTEITEYSVDYLDEGNLLALNHRPSWVP